MALLYLGHFTKVIVQHFMYLVEVLFVFIMLWNAPERVARVKASDEPTAVYTLSHLTEYNVRLCIYCSLPAYSLITFSSSIQRCCLRYSFILAHNLFHTVFKSTLIEWKDWDIIILVFYEESLLFKIISVLYTNLYRSYAVIIK